MSEDKRDPVKWRDLVLSVVAKQNGLACDVMLRGDRVFMLCKIGGTSDPPGSGDAMDIEDITDFSVDQLAEYIQALLEAPKPLLV